MGKVTLVFVVGLLAMGAGPALAVEELSPDPVRLYRVVDVAASDVLNIRMQPDPGAEIVGTLAPDASEIAVAGTRMEIGGSVWWQVVGPAETGWVNARFLEPLDEAAGEREAFPLQCLGTEPFWSVTIDAVAALFETPMEEPESWQAGPMTYATGLVGRFAVELESEGAIGHLAAWRNHRFCSDGMSDIGYPYEAILVAPGGPVYGGCCRRAGA